MRLSVLLFTVLVTFHSVTSDSAPSSCERFRDARARTTCNQLLDEIQNLTTFSEMYNRNSEFPALANVRKELSDLTDRVLDMALNPLLAVTYNAMQSQRGGWNIQPNKPTRQSNGPITYYIELPAPTLNLPQPNTENQLLAGSFVLELKKGID